MIEQLPPELAKLIAAEKLAPAADRALRAVVRAKLATSIAGAPLGASVAGGLGAGKVLAILAVVVGAGTVAVVKSQRSPAPSVATSRGVVVAQVEPTPPTPQPQPQPPPLLPPPRTPVVAIPPVPSQAELLREAWTALSHADSARALELATLDARAHSSGALSEERDALRVVALATLGRMTEAATANTKFIDHYPNSIHRELIDKALAGAP